MKARLPKEPELVLLYRLDETSEKGGRIRAALQKLSLPAKTLTPQDLNQTLGYCANCPGFSKDPQPYTGPAMEEELLIMAGLEDSRVDALLLALRDCKAPVALKGVLTQTNRHWKLGALLEEMTREKQVMEAYRMLREQMSKADALTAPAPKTPEWEALACQMERAAALLQFKEDPTEAAFLNAAQAIEEAMDAL